MKRLKRCPCGERPTKMNIGNPPSRLYSYATPDCCDYFEYEYKSDYETDLEVLQRFAGEDWNKASRTDVPCVRPPE